MAHRPGARHRLILAIETSCDDTCAAVVTADGEMRSNVIASQGLLHERYGGVVPELASRRHLELVDAVTADALERAGARLGDVSDGGGDPRPGADRGAARRALLGEGAGRGPRAAARAGGPPARPRGGEHAAARSDRAALPLPRGERRPHVPRAGGRPGALHGARADARRRRRRGVRQGRPAARARLPGRARRSTAWRATGDPAGLRLPAQRARRARLQLQRAQDLAALPGARRAGRRGPPTSPPPTSARSSTRSWRDAARRSSARASSGWRSAAGWRPTRSCARPCPRSGWRCGCRRSSSAPTTRR